MSLPAPFGVGRLTRLGSEEKRLSYYESRPRSAPRITPPVIQRYRYHGKVRILVPFAPWRLLISATALEVSATGVTAFLQVEDGRGEGDDREALLVEGDPYDVQLEHAERDLPTPMVPARLTAREEAPTGFKLTFTFVEPTADLLAFVHELSLGETTPASPAPLN